MRRILCSTTIVLMLMANPSFANLTVEVDGVNFSRTVEAMDQQLHLHGAGTLMYMLFIKAYAGALYLPESVPPAHALQPVAKKLVLEYFHPIKGQDFAKATQKKIADNVTADQMDALQPRVDHLAALYRNVEPGDRYALTYIPDEGTTLSLNGESLGLIPGEDFAQAVFAIWLGENPIDSKFRKQLLSDLW